MIDTIYLQKIELLSHCTFQVASWPKRFVRDMKALTLEPDTELTVKQRRAIDNLYWHYRKQVWYWIEALPMPDAPDVVKPYSAFEDSSDESTRILGEQLERWGDLDAKEANDQILVLREKPSQTPKQQKAREKLERWNKLVGGS